jgi:hypothetical protein
MALGNTHLLDIWYDVQLQHIIKALTIMCHIHNLAVKELSSVDTSLNQGCTYSTHNLAWTMYVNNAYNAMVIARHMSSALSNCLVNIQSSTPSVEVQCISIGYPNSVY